VGYFLDNEFGWGDDYFLSIDLGWGAEEAGKTKLVQVLKDFYKSDFRAFLADFRTSAKDWDGLVQAKDATRRPGRGRGAVDAWMYEVARRYYSVAASAVRQADPGCLILGDRFRQYYPQAVARAAKGLLDAVSTNYESTTRDGWISPVYFESLHELSGLPVIVGEFYTAARQNRSGNRNHGGEFCLVDGQVQRAVAAGLQVRELAAMPFVVGWHWFQYMDEPTFGRNDGEDYDMGLVDIHDQPYAEITNAFAGANADAEWLHKPGSGPRQDLPWQVPSQTHLVADGKLDAWDKAKPLPSAWLETPQSLAPFGDVFLAWDKSNLWLAARVYDFNYPQKELPQAGKPETWAEAERLDLGIGDFQFSGCAALVEDPDNKSGRQVVYTRPPEPGHLQPAVSASIDAWNYVWELAIPAAELGKKSLRKGQRFWLKMNIRNRGNFARMDLGGDKGLEILLR
jgi:hypothetical protein